MSRLNISLLGTFQVTLDGKSVTQFQVDAARLLLAYLAMDPQVSFRREILAGLLWPEKPELSASKNFRTTLNRLRNAIGDKTAVPPYLTITRKNIQFNRASNHWLDVTQFSTLIEKTRQHHHPHLITCPSCIKNLTKAATLYQGEFMHGFSSNSNMLDTWLAETREHLHPQIMMTLFQLAHHHEKQTCDYEQVQFYARRQLKLEPWQEASHRQMMRALAFSGQRNAALLRYDMCRQILADELGIQPTARTTRLYRKIEAGAYSNHKANLYDGITIPQNQHNSDLPIVKTTIATHENEFAHSKELLNNLENRRKLNITLLSPYHGGSHKAWAAGYTAVSHHNITLMSMPDRFWKWRMHGGAITLGRRFLEQAIEADLILATDMLDLTTFLALTRAKTSNTPAILYMHENQLTYPLPADGATGPMRRQLGERDRHYAFINFASMLAADQVLFNSDYHLTSFLQELPNFLKHFPEYNELGTIQTLQKKSAILPVGVDFQRLTHHTAQTDNDIPLILWNQRWEYDKNPEAFFELLYHLADEGVPFRLALCGQQYGKRPLIFTQALEKLADHIIHVGHADADLYQSLLWQADVTISTAHHEFFGISILEAIYCHTFPILPNRLSYPELIPSAYHDRCLYHNKESLIERTKWVLSQRQQSQKIAGELATAVSRYDWTKVAKKYDNFFANFTRHKH